jgi:hypothetical protein
MDSLFDTESISRVTDWLDSDNRSSTSRADSQSVGGVSIPPSVKSNYARTTTSSAGLVTRQGLRNQQLPNTNAGVYVNLSGMVYPPAGQQFQMPQSVLQIAQHGTTSPQEDKSGYTIALMEHGQKTGTLPVYDPSVMLSQNPPSHRRSLKIGNIRASGTASTVKAAKHEASCNACRILRIKPK